MVADEDHQTANRLIVALDTDDLARLSALAAAVGPAVGHLKVGLQAFAAHGPEAVRAAAAHAPVFCDLKLHDIPNTVAGAAAAAADLGVAMLTVHAAGGPAMIAAAVEAAPDVTVLAVTVLTSLDDAALRAVGQPPAAEQVPRLAALAAPLAAAFLIGDWVHHRVDERVFARVVGALLAFAGAVLLLGR